MFRFILNDSLRKLSESFFIFVSPFPLLSYVVQSKHIDGKRGKLGECLTHKSEKAVLDLSCWGTSSTPNLGHRRDGRAGKRNRVSYHFA